MIKLIREETFAEAAREGVSLIHTFCYAKGDDDEQYRRMIARVEDNGGEVHSVLLVCDYEHGAGESSPTRECRSAS